MAIEPYSHWARRLKAKQELGYLSDSPEEAASKVREEVYYTSG